jgi:hypothetical protein
MAEYNYGHRHSIEAAQVEAATQPKGGSYPARVYGTCRMDRKGSLIRPVRAVLNVKKNHPRTTIPGLSAIAHVLWIKQPVTRIVHGDDGFLFTRAL